MLQSPPRAPIPKPPAAQRIIGVRGGASTARPFDAEPPPDPDRALRWQCLVGGLFAAWALGFVLPGSFAWFLAAIPHEMGHATAGCLLGRPSTPAISLAGEAWTGISERRDGLVWLIAIAVAAGAVTMRQHKALAIALGAAALLLPLIAFGRFGEILIAAAGHLGELAFAAYCYAVCWGGGRTGSAAERGAGAMAGALLQVGNIRLCWGLLHDPTVRDHYATSGSLGLKNDYLVLAEDLCNCGLGRVAGLMLVFAVLALPLGLWFGHREARTR
jgi:hypothetical protein